MPLSRLGQPSEDLSSALGGQVLDGELRAAHDGLFLAPIGVEERSEYLPIGPIPLQRPEDGGPEKQDVGCGSPRSNLSQAAKGVRAIGQRALFLVAAVLYLAFD